MFFFRFGFWNCWAAACLGAVIAPQAMGSQMAKGSVAPSVVTAIILNPDGLPASGAKAVFAPSGDGVEIIDGQKFDNDPKYQRATLGTDGRLQFAITAKPFVVVIIDAAGYAELHQQPSREVRLEQWGRVEGRFMIGRKPGAGAKVVCFQYRPDTSDPDYPTAYYETDVITDAGGRFFFPRVAGGKVDVALDPKFSWGSLARPMQAIEVYPNKTTTCAFGGLGRPVVGRVIIPPELARRKDWEFFLCEISPELAPIKSPTPADLGRRSLQEQAKWYQALENTDAVKAYKDAQSRQADEENKATQGFDIDANGTFRIEEAPAGTYSIIVNAEQKSTGQRIGHGVAKFTVPPMPGGRDDQPLVIAPVKIEPLVAPQIGRIAPDFSVPGFDGRQLKLSDFRGKYVLLDFWATWCGPCIEEMPNLQDVFAAYGKNPRFKMISLSVDSDPNDPIRYVADHGFKWNQGYLGDWKASTVTEQFNVHGIPSIWLIGPDGKIIAIDLRGEKIKAAVAKALHA